MFGRDNFDKKTGGFIEGPAVWPRKNEITPALREDEIF